MPEVFQKLFQRDETVHSLNVQAAMGPVRQPDRSQFSLLVRHFLERFFNHEDASATGEGKARLVQLACAAGLPGLMVAVYLWPAYHPFPGWPPGRTSADPPAYWVQANHHFFFVVYSFVVMGLITVFEWDLFFPDLLDVFVLGTLPVPALRAFGARVAAIAVFLIGFLVDANVAAVVMLPIATEPSSVTPLVVGHLTAVATAGAFSAGLAIALQSALLATLGERLFRRVSLLLQGGAVVALLVLLLLFPVLSGVTPALLQAGTAAARWFPPFWFLGMFEQGLGDASAHMAWAPYARTAWAATGTVWAATVILYPLAHVRRVRGLVQGTVKRTKRNWAVLRVVRVLHRTLLRAEQQRAVFHFISQTILRVVRYRIYLVLYGGVGVSLVTATILRLEFRGGRVHAVFSAEGMRIAIGIVAFWALAGLRSTFASPGNQRGGWIFRAIHGKPPGYAVMMQQLNGARLWALLWTAAATLGAIGVFHWIAPEELRTGQSVVAQVLTGVALCVILTDGFFLNGTNLPFTGERPGGDENLALTALRFFTFFPFVMALAVGMETWVEAGGTHLAIAVAGVTVVHLWMEKRHRETVRLYCAEPALEEGEDEFPTRLGLRELAATYARERG